MVSQRAGCFCALLVTVGAGCKPDQEGRPSLLEQPRVLAIQTMPAEVTPGESVTFTVLRAGADGLMPADTIELGFCVQRKPLAAPGVIAPACLVGGAKDAVIPITEQPTTVATIPADACSIFGPSQPITTLGQPPLRPVDPDTTGGYYQPVRLIDAHEESVSFVRLLCGLAGTTPENGIAWKKRYLANSNPHIARIVYARADNELVPFENSEVGQFRPGERIQFAVTWERCALDEQQCGDGVCGLDEDASQCATDCAQPPIACGGAETYTLLDPASNQLRLARETIRVSWYVTGGSLERDSSGRRSYESERDAQNAWVAPPNAGDHWLVAVIRDDRGGVGWTARALHVGP